MQMAMNVIFVSFFNGLPQTGTARALLLRARKGAPTWRAVCRLRQARASRTLRQMLGAHRPSFRELLVANPPSPLPSPPPSASALPPARVLLLGAYLVGGMRGHHSGNFKTYARRQTLHQLIDAFIRESHASLDGVRLAIVHDIEALGNRSTYRNADLLLVPSVSMPPQQARWRAYVQAFRGVAAIPPDRCVFAIDLNDVRMINDAAELCRLHKDKLFVGFQYYCGRKKDTRFFARDRGKASKFNATGAYAEWLSDPSTKRSRSVWQYKNAGIIGGVHRRLWPFVEAKAAAIDAHVESLSRDPNASDALKWSIDMPVTNALLLNRNELLVSGWPHGPVNMPFWGQLCYKHKCATSSPTYHSCIRSKLQALATTHFFTHKLSWNRSKVFPYIYDSP